MQIDLALFRRFNKQFIYEILSIILELNFFT